MIAFIIIICRRKLADYFLQWASIVLVVGMAFRVAMFIITVSVYSYAESSNQTYGYLQLELQVFYFTVPYYLFLMVTFGLLFSAHSSYKSLRNGIFPDLRERDGILRPVSLQATFGLKMTTRCRYLFLLAVITFLVIVEQCLIIFGSDNKYKEGRIFSTPVRLSIWGCEVTLFIIQILVLIAGYAVLTAYIKLYRARPKCISGAQCDDKD